MAFTIRNPISLVFLCVLALWNATLESAIFWNVGRYRFDKDTKAENQEAISNYMGLAFLASSDIFQIMAFAQVMQMPQIYPVFMREVTNNMYSASAFYAAAVASIICTFIFYPLTITFASFFWFGLPDSSFSNLLAYLACMVAMMFAGASFGFLFGTIFKDPIIAAKFLENIATLFQFGGGMIVNVSSKANYLARFLSYTSPQRYGAELLFRVVTTGLEGQEVIL